MIRVRCVSTETLGLVSPDLSARPRKTYPNRCKTAVLRMLPLVGGASLRCRWEVEAPFSGHVEQGPLKLSQPRGLPGVGCTWHGFAVDRPVWIRRLGSRLLVLGSHLPAHPFELLQPPQGPEM